MDAQLVVKNTLVEASYGVFVKALFGCESLFVSLSLFVLVGKCTKTFPISVHTNNICSFMAWCLILGGINSVLSILL